MPEITESWGEYGKLVLKELERLNDNHEKMRTDFDQRFQEINQKISEIKSIEKTVNDHKNWVEKVSEVWSVSQMKEAKDEIYKQKTRWTATIAIITFVQILIGLLVAVWRNIHT